MTMLLLTGLTLELSRAEVRAAHEGKTRRVAPTARRRRVRRLERRVGREWH